MAENDQKPNEGEQQPSDIDKLRSEYDSKLAEANKANSDLQERLDRLDAAMKAGSQTDADLGAIQKRIDAVDRSDPAKALAAMEDIALELGGAFVNSKVQGAQIAGLYKDSLANYYAAEIAAVHGGDPKTYAKELKEKSTTDTQMKANADLLREKVGIEKQKKGGNGGGDNADAGGRYRVDDGRGAPVRTDLLKKMQDIDVTTPEGRKEWEEQEKSFAAAIRDSNSR